MIFLKHTFTALFLFGFMVTAIAQNDDNDTEAAEKPKEENLAKETQKANAYFVAKEYYKAAEIYKKAFSKEKSRKGKADITFNLAECYRFMNDCKNASAQYKRAVKMRYDDIAQLRYAEMLKCLGEYEDAIVEYEIYKQDNPGDARGEEGIMSCKKAIEWRDKPTRYSLVNQKDFNTKSSDYHVAYAGKRSDDYTALMISSMREESEGKREDGWTGQTYSDIYTVEAERKKGRGGRRGRGAPAVEELNWSTPVPLSEIINTKEHEGVVAFDSRMKTMYFTRCINEKNMKLGCGIYTTKKMGQDWAQPEFVVLAPDSLSSVGHPTLSADDKFLFFAGEMPGTKGGKDIWVTTYDRRAKQWNPAKNLGPKVNTEEDEVYPFMHDDGYLYFSSNGLPGMGGLDVFRIKIGEDGMPMGDAENMKFPINDNTDDFGIIWEKGGAKKGFMASDRKGGRGSDDIYSVYLVPLKFTMDGVVVSSKDGQPISQATVRLDGTDGTSIVVNTDKDGHFFFDKDKLKEDTQYKINVEKKKFLTNTGDFTTIGVDLSAFEFVPSENIYLHGMRMKVALDPIDVPIVLPNVLFALAKWDLTPASMASLDTVVKTLELNPTLVVELRSHTDYRDTDEKNDILSQHRADTCVKYLISKGIAADRLVPRGMGEKEPRIIDEDYKNKKYYKYDEFEVGTELTEAYIKRQSAARQEIANQINRRTDIKVLRDDYVPNAPAPGTETAEDKPKEEAKAVGEFHECAARETFGKIAKQYGISVVDLKKINNGLRGVRVFEGLLLKVTKDGDYTEWDATHYQVQMRDNLKTIANKLNMSDKDLRDLNDGIKDKDLQPGMWLNIQ